MKEVASKYEKKPGGSWISFIRYFQTAQKKEPMAHSRSDRLELSCRRTAREVPEYSRDLRHKRGNQHKPSGLDHSSGYMVRQDAEGAKSLKRGIRRSWRRGEMGKESHPERMWARDIVQEQGHISISARGPW